MNDIQTAYAILRRHRDRLTRQQVKTLAGQIKHGKPEEAMKGLRKLVQNEFG